MDLNKQYIKDLTPGMRIKSFFICSEMKVKESKMGDRFADIMLSDKTGELNLKIWNYTPTTASWLQAGTIVYVIGAVVKEYNSALQISMDSNSVPDMLRLCSPQEVDMSDLVKATDEDVSLLIKELKEMVESVDKQPIKCILKSIFFDDEEFMSKFTLWPAAIKHHHAYAGGLLEHTVGVLRVCIMASKNYTASDRDFLIAGALLHDIGKTESYSYDMAKGNTTLSARGLMEDHIQIGVEILSNKANNLCTMCPKKHDSCETLTEELFLQLKHLILSHHGTLEWGSPVQPATIEASILHYADNLDAQVNKFQRVIIENRSTSYAGTFKYVETLGRFIFISKEQSRK